jgi:poly(A) polymerase
MDGNLERLAASGIRAFESSFTALDAYFEIENPSIRFALAPCTLQDLASVFDELRYPGTHYADAAVFPQAAARTAGMDNGAKPLARGAGDRKKNAPTADRPQGPLYLRCADTPKEAESAAFSQLDLLRDPARDVFLDPKDVYPSLRSKSATLRPAEPERQLFESVILVSRYHYELAEDELPPLPRDFGVDAQRDMLELTLTGARPERGLELLRRIGFLDAYWPELASLAGTEQSKDFHPEGDAWAHTLETFRHRKEPDLGLSLALLLHDTGKPKASESEGRRFDRHAEIGRSVAERFLLRLGFGADLVSEASFLVRYHMMPAALPRLPANRLEGVIDDPRFPVLLELYRCDELSTFRGPDGYYDACAAYRAWLKNARNPWRGADGKRLVRKYVEPTQGHGHPARR